MLICSPYFMACQSTIKKLQAEIRRQERAAQKRARELQREAKEFARLNEISRARLEVESYENRIELLLSIHKEQGPTWDWIRFATALAPAPPVKAWRHELSARQKAEFLTLPERSLQGDQLLREARRLDEQEFSEATEAHRREIVQHLELASFAKRILAGEAKAYTEALAEFSPLVELTDLGSSIHFTVHDRYTLECRLSVSGTGAIPAEIKSFTASGKVSSKKMPKNRFHELYQDYVCGCTLRVGREVFALLPVETVLITALIEAVDSRTVKSGEMPILSVAVTRRQIAGLNFEELDPSDFMENFFHRGDAKGSRRTGEFTRIEPLTVREISSETTNDLGVQQLLDAAGLLRQEIRSQLRSTSKRFQNLDEPEKTRV